LDVAMERVLVMVDACSLSVDGALEFGERPGHRRLWRASASHWSGVIA